MRLKVFEKERLAELVPAIDQEESIVFMVLEGICKELPK